jgi:hypothetical protein
LSCWRAFGCDRGANVAIIFALTLPVMIAAVAAAVDYSLANATRTKMQAVADAAAIFAAREFQMAQSNPSLITAVAQNYVQSQFNDIAAKTTVDTSALTVHVDLAKEYQLAFGRVLPTATLHLQASATAKMSGGLPLCLLALDPKHPRTLTLQKEARLTAPNCLVYSDSKSPSGLVSKDDAVLQAGAICSAGGIVKTKNTNYTPQPLTDCPVLPDPLSYRQGPTGFTCDYTGRVVTQGATALSPGVYCGGLYITNAARVTLSPGVFVIKDGPLVVNGGASLAGNNVGLYMKGPGSNLTFAADSTISLTAPKDGPLAGILIFDDPTGAWAPETPPLHHKSGSSPRVHSILSDNARLLLGTIYMPQGRLIIDATKPIADRSAYTVMVLQQLDLYSGPNLVLNSDYGASEIPVPRGVGPYGGTVTLTN